jgi:protein SCO1/2
MAGIFFSYLFKSINTSLTNYKKEGTLPTYHQIHDYTFTERTGNQVSLSELKGKILVVNFLYTTCPGPCPIMASKLSELHAALKKEPNILIVSITLDPETDTLEKLNTYADSYLASKNRWLFLRAKSSDDVYQLAEKGFLLGATFDKNGLKTGDGPITHSTKMALVDRNGIIRGYYDSQSNELNQHLLLDIGKILREQPSELERSE